MIPDPTEFRLKVLWSLQRGLWDEVTPNLRGVAVSPTYPLIEATFIYEILGDEEREIVAEVETLVYADFSPPVNAKFTAVMLPMSERRTLGPVEEWVYLRKEPTDWSPRSGPCI